VKPPRDGEPGCSGSSCSLGQLEHPTSAPCWPVPGAPQPAASSERSPGTTCHRRELLPPAPGAKQGSPRGSSERRLSFSLLTSPGSGRGWLVRSLEPSPSRRLQRNSAEKCLYDVFHLTCSYVSTLLLWSSPSAQQPPHFRTTLASYRNRGPGLGLHSASAMTCYPPTAPPAFCSTARPNRPWSATRPFKRQEKFSSLF